MQNVSSFLEEVAQELPTVHICKVDVDQDPSRQKRNSIYSTFNSLKMAAVDQMKWFVGKNVILKKT